MISNDQNLNPAAGSALPANVVMQLTGQAPIAAVQIRNQSPLLIQVFGNGTSGLLLFTIQPYENATHLVNQYTNLTAVFQGSNSVAGSIYLLWSDTPLVAMTGQIVVPQPSQSKLFMTANGGLSGGNSGDLLSFSLISGPWPTIALGQSLWLTDLVVGGVDFQRLKYQIQGVLQVTGGAAITNVGAPIFRGNTSISFQTPVKIATLTTGPTNTTSFVGVTLQMKTLEAYIPQINVVASASGYIL